MSNELKIKWSVWWVTEYETYTSAWFDKEDDGLKFIKHLKETGIKNIRFSKKTELLNWRKDA